MGLLLNPLVIGTISVEPPCRHRTSASNGFLPYTRFLGFPEFSGYHQWQQESQ